MTEKDLDTKLLRYPKHDCNPETGREKCQLKCRKFLLFWFSIFFKFPK